MAYEQFSRDERYAIAGMKTRGYSKREIGRCLGRHPGTICREMKRNSFDQTDKYWAEKAHALAMARRYKSRKKSQYMLRPV